MSMRLWLFVSFCFFLFLNVKGQNSIEWGGMADLNKSLKINALNSVKQKLEARSFANSEISNSSRIDFQSILQRQLFLDRSIGVGFLYRFSDEGQMLRFIQQFAILSRKNQHLRLSHRFRFDQSIRESSTEYRLRYRLAAEIPLVGFRLDPDEIYFKAGLEALEKWRDSNFRQEFRATLSLGKSLKGNRKIEIGLDLRYDGILDESNFNSHWIRLGGYF